MRAVFVLLIANVVSALCSYSVWDWESWKQRNNKSYRREEEDKRREIWEDNKLFVERGNSNNSFQLELNRFGDLTKEEFSHNYLITEEILLTHKDENTNESLASLGYSDFPSYWDWRKEGAVTPVKDQGSCGSCYAFSATGALEGQYRLRYGELVSFSEQQVVDCSAGFGNWDCSGGWMTNVFSYWRWYGAELSEEYLYTGELGRCEYSSSASAAKVLWYSSVRASERDLMSALVNVGPIAIALDASSREFHFYSRGVYRDSSCSQRRFTHAMLVVGYGRRWGVAYWLLKNSWGESWGEEGYMRIARGNNTCGMLSRASYPAIYRL